MHFNFLNSNINTINQAIISGTNLNYNEYYNFINKTVENLNKFHFKSGEKVAIFVEKNESHLIIFFALLQIGVIVVPINKSLPENQILQMLSAINCNKLFVSDKSINKTFDSNIEVFQINEFIPDKILDTNAEKLKPISLKQDCTIIFTSGSSGNPKAALHSFGNHYYSAQGSNENIPFKPGDRWLLSLPLYHVGGLSILFRAIVGGGAIVIPDENLSMVENINKSDITHISLVATQLKQLLEDKDALKSLKNLKAILIGGSYISSDLIKESIENKLPIYTTYGSTEMASQITTTKTNKKLEKLFTSGRLLKHRELKIADDGEIFVKGETLFKGYIEKDSLIMPFDTDGWYHTGDLGKIDNEGYLSISGRKDKMFISGGENIHPEEIEKLLLNMKEIENAVVIDIYNEKYGARPVAFIKTKNYKLVNKENIAEYLSEFLPKFKIPDVFYKWPDKIKSIKPNRTEFKKFYDNQKLGDIV